MEWQIHKKLVFLSYFQQLQQQQKPSNILRNKRLKAISDLNNKINLPHVPWSVIGKHKVGAQFNANALAAGTGG